MKNPPTRILIIGATSAIAQQAARRFAADGASLHLVARSPERLTAVADDLRARGAKKVTTAAADLDRTEAHAALVAEAERALGEVDAALVAHGVLPSQRDAERDPAIAVASFATNATSVVSLLLHLAPSFERRRGGVIAVISSVAGDRGRASNHVYGASKAAVSAFMEGLRHRLRPAGVAVLTVKPGFVDTPMTAHVRKGILFASAKRVGGAIHDAMAAHRSGTLYLPWFWRPIMGVIRHLPESIMAKLPL